MPTNRSPTFGGSQDFEAAPFSATFVTLNEALLMLRPQPSPGWRVRPNISSSTASGIVPFSAFARAQASQASSLVYERVLRVVARPLPPAARIMLLLASPL
jgi:hypothetical protein